MLLLSLLLLLFLSVLLQHCCLLSMLLLPATDGAIAIHVAAAGRCFAVAVDVCAMAVSDVAALLLLADFFDDV